MNVSVIGNGYVGLVTAVGLACRGHTLFCIEQDGAKIDLINQGTPPIHEEGLEGALRVCVNRNRSLSASSDYEDVLRTDLTLICVGTSCGPNGSIDLTCIEESVQKMGQVLARKDAYHVVVVKSTVIPGTTEQVIIPLLEKASGKKVGRDIGVVVNPEFLQEGKALRCFFNPDRIVIGESDPAAGDLMESLYQPLNAPVLRSDLTTAEMVKYASNAFLATRISFMNEVGNMCRELGIDVYDVAAGMSYDPRIGGRFLNAGVGFGGSCLPKDVRALISAGSAMGCRLRLLESVLEVNNAQAERMVDMAESKLGTLERKIVAVLGLAFKPGTDDVREAPALRVVRSLSARGAIVKAYDPVAMPNAKKALSNGVEYCGRAEDAVAGSDCVLVLTEWDDFKCEELYYGKVVIDGRRVLDPRRVPATCEYQGICW